MGQLSFLCLGNTECTLDLGLQTPAVYYVRARARELGCNRHNQICSMESELHVTHSYSKGVDSVILLNIGVLCLALMCPQNCALRVPSDFI